MDDKLVDRQQKMAASRCIFETSTPQRNFSRVTFALFVRLKPGDLTVERDDGIGSLKKQDFLRKTARHFSEILLGLSHVVAGGRSRTTMAAASGYGAPALQMDFGAGRGVSIPVFVRDFTSKALYRSEIPTPHPASAAPLSSQRIVERGPCRIAGVRGFADILESPAHAHSSHQ